MMRIGIADPWRDGRMCLVCMHGGENVVRNPRTRENLETKSSRAGGCHVTSSEIQPVPDIKHPKPVGTVIAPVFDRGERLMPVSSGPVAAYLTEEEGLQIVLQELQRYGLKMSLQDVQFGMDERPLRIDLMDPDRHVAIEFFSESDIPGDNPRDRFLADLRPRALDLANRAAEQGNDIYLGVMYDPATHYYVGRGFIPSGDDEEDQQREEQARLRAEADRLKALEESKQILREQVKYFTDWLAAQGVI